MIARNQNRIATKAAESLFGFYLSLSKRIHCLLRLAVRLSEQSDGLRQSFKSVIDCHWFAQMRLVASIQIIRTLAAHAAECRQKPGKNLTLVLY